MLELSGEVPNDGGFPDDILSDKTIETCNGYFSIMKDLTVDMLYTELHTDKRENINLQKPILPILKIYFTVIICNLDYII